MLSVTVTALGKGGPGWGTHDYEQAGSRQVTSQQSSNRPPSWPALCPASRGMFWTSPQSLTPCMGSAPPRHPLGGEGFDPMSWLSLTPIQIPRFSLTSLQPSLQQASPAPSCLRTKASGGPWVVLLSSAACCMS